MNKKVLASVLTGVGLLTIAAVSYTAYDNYEHETVKVYPVLKTTVYGTELSDKYKNSEVADFEANFKDSQPSLEVKRWEFDDADFHSKD